MVAQLQIDASGKVVGCAVTTSSGSAALDERTCEIALSRMTFTPGKGEQGRSVASTYKLAVRWLLPTVTPGGSTSFMPVRPFAVVVEQVVSGDGTRRSCKARDDYEDLTDPQICAAAMGDLRAALRLLPPAMRGHPFVLFSESRQEYSGLPNPLAMGEDVMTLGRIVTRFTIGAGGKATGCIVTGSPRAEEAQARSPCSSTVPFALLPGTAVTLPVAATWTESIAVRSLPEAGGV